ncbi:MAG: ABC transporter substrate-binding protein [Alphaproteobacteria bacterium]|nr:ABC transporter substrate-binding protein [Alphaproteobacteria bacterium]
MRELGRRFEASTSIALDAEYGPTVLLVKRLEAGAQPDVVALTKEKVDQYAGEGAIAAGSAVDLVRSFVGVAVKAGSHKPAIATTAEFKRALLDARSIGYSRTGASGLFFAELLKRLGIADAVNAKATVIPEGFTAELAASGKVGLAIQQVSELMAVPGVEIVGPLPREIEPGSLFSVGIWAASSRQAEAARLIAFLASAEAASVIRQFGLEPLT